MKVKKEVIKTWVVSNLKFGRTKEDIEGDFKTMLKQKTIDVDDYYNAMEIIYDEGGDAK